MDRLLIKQANLYQLQKRVDDMVADATKPGVRFSLTEAAIKELHGIAMKGLLTTAGTYRDGEVTVAAHIPPKSFEVDGHMTGLCRYVTEQWDKRDLVHLCAFVMWRLNWIHPFENGNGRTARAASYLVLCAKHGKLLPAKNSVISQIIQNREPYYKALPLCDAMHKAGKAEFLEPLEGLVAYLLKEQIKAALS